MRNTLRIVLVLVVLIAAMAVPIAASAHTWYVGSCGFTGTNGFNGNDAWSKTNEAENCYGLGDRIQYKLDGNWYWSGYHYCLGSSNPTFCKTTIAGADDHGASYHRGQTNITFIWSSWKYHT